MDYNRPDIQQNKEPSAADKLVDFDYETYEKVERKAVKTDGKVALAAGIGSIILNFFFQPFAVVLAGIAIHFGRKGKKDPEQEKMAAAGFACGIIGLLISIAIIVLLIANIGDILALPFR